MHILLDHLNGVFIYLSDDGDMAKSACAENQKIISHGSRIPTVLELEHSAGWIELTMGDLRIEKITRMSPDAGHVVAVGYVVKSLNVFHALPFLAVVITVIRIVLAMAGGDHFTILIGRHIFIPTDLRAYFRHLSLRNCWLMVVFLHRNNKPTNSTRNDDKTQ